MVEPAWTRIADGTLHDRRSHPLKVMVLGPVCPGCNNGWMSALESKAKPTLLELASGSLRLEDLSPPQRVVVARWALKTAVALNASSNFHHIATPEQAASTRADQLTDGVIVLAHVLPQPDARDMFWWLQSEGIAQMLNAGDEDNVLLLQRGAWRCFLAFAMAKAGDSDLMAIVGRACTLDDAASLIASKHRGELPGKIVITLTA